LIHRNRRQCTSLEPWLLFFAWLHLRMISMKLLARSVCNWRRRLASFIEASNGATSIEYAFIAMLIALVIIGGVAGIGPSLAKIFTNVSSGFNEGSG